MSQTPNQPPRRPANRGNRAIVAALLIFLTLVIGLVVLGASYMALWRPDSEQGQSAVTPSPSAAAAVTPTPVRPISTGTVPPSTPAAAISAEESLRILREIEVPPRDLPAIVARLKLKTAGLPARTTDKPPGNYTEGHSDVFFVHNIAARNYYTITARVEAVTDNAYWYVQEGEAVDEDALRSSARIFEEEIYPTNTRIFGNEWKPGVDNDPRITILLADIPNVGGYYSSADEYTREVNPFSNEREMIYINMGTGWNGIPGTLAHELQHMIHWNSSPNHDVWVNEGSSMLAEVLNGYVDVGVDAGFMSDTDVQLNAWQQTPGESLRHYGAGFLFLQYLHSQYGGDKMVRALVAGGGQGSSAVNNALEEMGNEERFEDVFKRWVGANLLDTVPGAPDDLLYPDRDVSARMHERVRSYPATIEGTVAQFGADYIELMPPDGGGDVVLELAAEDEVGVVSTKAHSGEQFWWSNRGDVSNTSMTRGFDLRGVDKATLDFSIWYDIEPGFDYGYVSASTDGGTTWETLKGEYTTTDNPNGTNLGNAYTGKSEERDDAESGGWLKESLNLSPYAGQEVEIRFEYITDDGYNAQGLAIDDIAIRELGYTDDAEGSSDWETSGFAHISDRLPQEHYVAVALFDDDGPQIQPIEVSEDGSVTYTIEGLGVRYSSAVLIISGTTPFTLQRAPYRLDVRAGE